jgi:hypothetical protein
VSAMPAAPVRPRSAQSSPHLLEQRRLAAEQMRAAGEVDQQPSGASSATQGLNLPAQRRSAARNAASCSQGSAGRVTRSGQIVAASARGWPRWRPRASAASVSEAIEAHVRRCLGDDGERCLDRGPGSHLKHSARRRGAGTTATGCGGLVWGGTGQEHGGSECSHFVLNLEREQSWESSPCRAIPCPDGTASLTLTARHAQDGRLEWIGLRPARHAARAGGDAEARTDGGRGWPAATMDAPASAP